MIVRRARSPIRPFFLAIAATLFAIPSAHGAGSGGHGAASVVLALAVVLVAAKLGGDLATRLGQPAVLGELLGGVILGNLPLIGLSIAEPLRGDPALDLLSRIGVLILLFEVGLESTVEQMLKVGASSLLVAVLGVVAPMLLGWGVGVWLLPEAGWYVHLFLGATLAATSVGITARVLQDLGKSQSTEARIVLGAAVLDDVLGLIVLAIVAGIISAADKGTSLSWLAIAGIFAKATVFLAGALALGGVVIPRIFALASRLKSRNVLLTAGLVLCFFLAWVSSAIGLDPIVGAFAAGLILEHPHYTAFVERGERSLEDTIHPISAFLVPIFFVVMGMRTDLTSFARLDVLALAGALTIAAVIGKQICSLGVLGKGVDRLAVGLGMIPRGEVGLIFANIGLTLTVAGQPVMTQATYSAVVVMVIVTTLVTPPLLKWRMK